jgi:hypothetical protein
VPKNAEGRPCGYGGKKERTHPVSAFIDGRWYLHVFDPNGHLRRLSGAGLPEHQDIFELADACYEDEPWYDALIAALYPRADREPEPVLVPLRLELVLIEGEALTEEITVEVEDIAA